MSLPDVLLTKRNGGLGRQKPTEDGISAFITQGVALAGRLEFGTVYELRGLSYAQALGLSETVNPLAYYHISEFYRLSPGAVLYFMLVAVGVKLTDICDMEQPYAAKLLATQNGKVKQLAVALAPGVHELEADVVPAIQKAQALAAAEYSEHRPVFIALAGHGYTGTAADAIDLRTLASEYVALVLATDHTRQPTEPAIGAVLGVLSAAAVNLCIGWVGGFPLQGDGSFLNAGLPNGTANAELLRGELGALHDKGYIVAVQHAGADGFYLSDSPTCTALTSDYAWIENTRTANKATTVIRGALLPQLKGPLLLNSDGTLQEQVRGELEGKARQALEVNMSRKGELSALDVYIDPDQVLSSGDELEVLFSLVPVGVARRIKGSIGFVTGL
jgi:hypothetical protein